jgi:hypothetical protein
MIFLDLGDTNDQGLCNTCGVWQCKCSIKGVLILWIFPILFLIPLLIHQLSDAFIWVLWCVFGVIKRFVFVLAPYVTRSLNWLDGDLGKVYA